MSLPSNLVSTDWLETKLDRANLVVADMRGYVNATPIGGGKEVAEYVGALDEYEAGHIPGAVYIDWTTDIIDPDDPIPVQIAPPALFKQAMEERGIGDDTDVVIVDHKGGHFATRLWWALKYYGHDRSAVLDGGYAKWIAEDRPMTTELPTARSATFTPRVRPELRIEADDILLAQDSGAQVLDARDQPVYAGDVWRGSRGGHIPGALLTPAKSLVNADGTWKSLPELEDTVTAMGISLDRPTIAYCNGGVTATAVLFALDRLGYKQIVNYDGSWNEWGERLDLPVESSKQQAVSSK